jgi:acyl-homoserine lactone acylase PvdQ
VKELRRHVVQSGRSGSRTLAEFAKTTGLFRNEAMQLGESLMLRRIVTIVGALVALALLGISIYAAGIAFGFRSAANADGRQSGLALHGPVQIVRDERFIPHIRARDEHDLFFAQGYAVGSDRLFQIDLMRRLVYGRLAEIFGPPALATDEESRTVDVAALAERQWEHIGTRGTERVRGRGQRRA